MKNLRLSLIVILLSCTVLSLSSQTIDKYGREVKRVQFIGRTAVNLSTMTAENKGGGYYGTEKSRVGYNFGVMADIAMGKNFYFQPNLSFSAKGSKIRGLEEVGGYEVSMNALYVQVPLLFAYKLDIQRWDNSFNIALGPYLAYGVGGTISGLADTFGNNGLCNRFDVGLNMELSFELPKFVFFMGYEYGFTNMVKNSMIKPEFQHNMSFHNSTNYYGVAYKF